MYLVAISLVSAAVSEREEQEKERVSQRLFVFFFSSFFSSHCVVSREEGKLLLSAGFLKKILLMCFCFVCLCVCVYFSVLEGFFNS